MRIAPEAKEFRLDPTAVAGAEKGLRNAVEEVLERG